MAQVEGTLPYARGRVFPLTIGANANSYLTHTYNIDRTYCGYGTFNGNEYIVSAAWYLMPANTTYFIGMLKHAFIATTPKYPKGVLVCYFLPYGASSTSSSGFGIRFLTYGKGLSTIGYWAVVDSYTSNNAVLKGKYLFETGTSQNGYTFTNSAGTQVIPNETVSLDLGTVSSIVGTSYAFAVYYQPISF